MFTGIVQLKLFYSFITTKPPPLHGAQTDMRKKLSGWTTSDHLIRTDHSPFILKTGSVWIYRLVTRILSKQSFNLFGCHFKMINLHFIKGLQRQFQCNPLCWEWAVSLPWHLNYLNSKYSITYWLNHYTVIYDSSKSKSVCDLAATQVIDDWSLMTLFLGIQYWSLYVYSICLLLWFLYHYLAQLGVKLNDNRLKSQIKRWQSQMWI